MQILELGFDNLNTINNGAPTLISTIVSFYFSHASNFDDVEIFILGSIDKIKFNREIIFNPLISTTPIIALSNDTVTIHKQIPGVQYFPLDLEYAIPSRNLIFLPATGTDCISTIMPGDIFPDVDVWVVGLAFIKNVFSVFDVENKKVGFAR
ncbi:28016_t:CDS:2, partial [Racocetra persica]